VSKRRVVPVVAWVVALVILATACKSAKTGAPAATPTGGTFTVESMEPGSLDPPLASGSEDARVERNLFDGLVRYDDKTAAVTPAVATSWDTNSDNTKFTFHLRSGTKFSNGEDVTAESFVRGMTRSLTPKLYNDPNGLGYHLDGIKGAADVSKGVTTTLTGAIARDKTTLEVDLDPGDRVVLYTDGITDVFDSHGEMLGVPGVQKFVRETSLLSFGKMTQGILDRVALWREGPPVDDVSLVLVEVL